MVFAPPSTPIATAHDFTRHRRRVRDYYDATVGYYRFFWHRGTGAVHYGFRDESTTGPASELLNTNRVLADLAGIDAGTRVFDAGCGVGGSSLWLARERGAHVIGASLSRRQLRLAQRQASRQRGSVAFQLADYTRAPYPDGCFDVFWGLESTCYTGDKRQLAREAFRLLRPGGRLVIGDGFLYRSPRDARERREYEWFRRGLVLDELGTVADLEQALQAEGFAAIRSWDKTRAADPSGRRMHRMCSLAYPIARAGQALGLAGEMLSHNIRAGIAQYRMIRSDLIGYAVVRATKPRHFSA